MNIEFHSAPNKVDKDTLNYVRDKLIELHQDDKTISRAQVYFREQDKLPGFACEIDLTIYGNSLFVHRDAKNFFQAARLALDELSEKVNSLIKKQNDPPDILTSTVEV